MTYTADISIVGGGLVGMTAALCFAQQGFSVLIVEKIAPNPHGSPDNRVFALAYDTVQWLETLGIDSQLLRQSPIETIRTSHHMDGQAFYFSYQDTPFTALGYMVSRHALLQALYQATATLPWIRPATVQQLHKTDHALYLHLDSGQQVSAPLGIAADGAYSTLRDLMGVRVCRHTFAQKALTFSVDCPLNATALEHFFSKGSIALLPQSQSQAAVVWMDAPEVIDDLVCCPEESLLKILQTHFPALTLGSLQGDRHAYPLQMLFPYTITKARCVLVGDAAHALHPIAGLGLNLGLRDLKSLSQHVSHYRTLGLDWGSITMLKAHARQRFSPTAFTLGLTTGIVYGFSLCPLPGLWTAARLLMRHSPWLKRWFIHHASFGRFVPS